MLSVSSLSDRVDPTSKNCLLFYGSLRGSVLLRTLQRLFRRSVAGAVSRVLISSVLRSAQNFGVVLRSTGLPAGSSAASISFSMDPTLTAS
jgi:hypothetical protein